MKDKMRFTTRGHYEKDWVIYLECTRCWEFKEINSFTTYKQSNAFMNKWSYCKECRKDYRQKNKEHTHEYRQEYNLKNRDILLEKRRKYNKEHSGELLEKSRNRISKMWYWPMHKKTTYIISKLWIRPISCPICNSDIYRIEAHHPDNKTWNKIVFCCQSCHSAIHNGLIKCPKPIDLLSIKDKHG